MPGVPVKPQGNLCGWSLVRRGREIGSRRVKGDGGVDHPVGPRKNFGFALE